MNIKMNFGRQFTAWSALTLLSSVVFLSCAPAQAQKKNRYACDDEKPESMCTAANTCGSPSSPCKIDVTRTGDSANVKPSIPDTKNNRLFCIKTGTTVIWMSSNKSDGFLVSFGSDSPFDPDGPIVGGAKKPITTKATTPGCYKYDAGAFRSGAIYGMSGGNSLEVVILP